MSTTLDDPNATPEPVTTVEWWKSTVLAALLATIGVLGALDVWHPTEGQVSAFSTAGAVLVATIFPVIAFFVRKRVTPNSKVALTHADVALLTAAGFGPPPPPPPPVDLREAQPSATASPSAASFGSGDFSQV